MRNLTIDNCQYCACLTHVSVQDNSDINDLINGLDLVCWNCAEYSEEEDNHSKFDIFENGKKIWCGHDKKCEDLITAGNGGR